MIPATALRHMPTRDCDGVPAPAIFGQVKCPECGTHLCPCELAYGHDCED